VGSRRALFRIAEEMTHHLGERSHLLLSAANGFLPRAVSRYSRTRWLFCDFVQPAAIHL
jgi:hypothetical protein